MKRLLFLAAIAVACDPPDQPVTAKVVTKKIEDNIGGGYSSRHYLVAGDGTTCLVTLGAYAVTDSGMTMPCRWQP